MPLISTLIFVLKADRGVQNESGGDEVVGLMRLASFSHPTRGAPLFCVPVASTPLLMGPQLSTFFHACLFYF